MSNLIYILALVVVYLYTNARRSVGLLWALVFVVLQFVVATQTTLSSYYAAAITGGGLLILFELMLALVGDPFSRARVFGVLAALLSFISGMLSLVGFKPRSRLINVNDNAAVRQVFVQLQAERWDKVETQLLALTDGARHHLIRGLAGVARRPAEFDQWLEERPRSVLARVVSGQQRLAAGWANRGTGLEETVTKGRERKFKAHLAKAQADFQRAMLLNKKLSDPHVGMITVIMGSAGSRSELWDAFAKARVYADNHFQAHLAMVVALSPQWGGDAGEALGFGRITARQAPVGCPLVGVLAAAHIEHWLQIDNTEKDFQSGMYFRQSPVLQELTQAYRQLGACETLDSDLIEALNIFAFCFFKGGQYDLAREVMARLDGRYSEYPWQYCSEPLLATFDIGFAIDSVVKQLQPLSVTSGRIAQA